MPLPFIAIIDVFKLKTSLPADELWTSLTDQLKIGKDKGPVKLIIRVKIAHSFLQSVSNQFHIIILSLPM